MGSPEFVVWHGTDSPNPSNTPATLSWALINDGRRGAANYYIGQDGTIYDYIDPTLYIAWHAGAGGAKFRGYTSFDVNVHGIGIELEERITKTPRVGVTPASLESAALLALMIKKKYRIPLERAYHAGHREIVKPGYRSDPYSYSIDAILARAIELDTSTPIQVDPVFQASWSASGGIWKKNQLTPGYATSPASLNPQGFLTQQFERGVCRLEPDGSISWLLLSEITV